MKFKVIALLLFAINSTSLEAGRAPPHSGSWMIPANPIPSESVARSKDGYYALGTLVPTKLYRVARDVVMTEKNIVVFPAGTLLVPLADDRRSVCELSSRRGSAFPCLSDTDYDGKFDTYFGTQVFNELFLGSIGDDGGFERLPVPIELETLDPKTDTPRITLELQLYGRPPGILKIVVCTKVSWKSKYYDERSCLRRPQSLPMDSTGSVVVYGQKVRFDELGRKPNQMIVDYNREDVPFSTRWRFP